MAVLVLHPMAFRMILFACINYVAVKDAAPQVLLQMKATGMHFRDRLMTEALDTLRRRGLPCHMPSEYRSGADWDTSVNAYMIRSAQIQLLTAFATHTSMHHALQWVPCILQHRFADQQSTLHDIIELPGPKSGGGMIPGESHMCSQASSSRGEA